MNIFYTRRFLILLAIVNALGTIWGVVWYWNQLKMSLWYFWPVVPDSPLHAFLFGVFMLWLLPDRSRTWPFWRCFVAWTGTLGVIKYGLWTTIVLSQYLVFQGTSPSLEDLMLYISHVGMAAQGLVYMNRLPQAAWPAALAVLWFAVNDLCDYVLLTHPQLPLAGQAEAAGWTALALTVAAAGIGGLIIKRKREAAGN